MQSSGGERQRTAIARALLSQPRLLLLDEPLASLDAERREEVLPYLESLRDRVAIPMVYVSHDFDEVLRLATHLVLMDGGRVVAQGGVGEMNLRPELRTIIGPDAVGAIVDGEVLAVDPSMGLARVRVGAGELRLRAGGSAPGARVRIQILARDVIVATRPPEGISVRNVLEGRITAVTGDDEQADLISIDIGAASVLARITKAATHDLALRPGMTAWALVKAVSLRGRSLAAGPPVQGTFRSARPQMHDARDMVVGTQSDGGLDPRIIGCRSGLPHHAEAHGMRSQEQILNGGAHREHLFDLGHLRVVAHDAAADHDHHGRAPDLGALDLELFLGRGRRALAPRLHHRIGEPLARSRVEHRESPGFEPAVIRCASGGLDQPRQLFGRGAGRGQPPGGRTRFNGFHQFHSSFPKLIRGVAGFRL